MLTQARRLVIVLLLFVAVPHGHPTGSGFESPRAIAEELLAVDRGFAASAAGRNVVDALTAMFRDDVTMSMPGGFATSRELAKKALAANADNLKTSATWTPLRAGISADGAQGFTIGLMTIRGAGDVAKHAKYMAYWIKEAGGWRVAVYKRAPAPAPDGPPAVMAASLPSALVPVAAGEPQIETHRDSLRRAEQTFSDDAQKIGIGPAFRKYGRADAVNMGGGKQPGFTVGAEAISAEVGAGGRQDSSPVSWSADRVIVASSGDLGVSIGYIRSNDPAAGRPPFPFFTIWRRDGPSAPWRYIAE